jgi:eukaryotic-like serine/threonine-protein kinase
MADSRSSAQVTINDRFDVIPDEPLPEFDCGSALAYRVRHHRDSSLSLFGLVCDPRLPMRLDKFNVISRIESPYLMRLNDWGIADWPLTNSQCPILVFERPPRGKLFGSLDQEIEPLHEDFVIKYVVQPVYNVLREFREIGVAHRNIRPDNVFVDGVGESNMVLGQCLSSSPGFEQPFICETIESCMSAPSGRGAGVEADDMYSLGVVLAAMITGAVPGAGMSDQEILDAKLSEGSAAIMARGGRISLSMMEGLRGLLNDDADERWTLEDLGQWANGKRGSPIQSSLPLRASRGFEFDGRNYSNCREVGNAMSKNWSQAAAVIHDG